MYIIGNCETNVSQSGGVQIYDLGNDTHTRLSAKAVPRSRHKVLPFGYEAMTATGSGGVQIYDLGNDTHARLSAKAVPQSRHNEAPDSYCINLI